MEKETAKKLAELIAGMSRAEWGRLVCAVEQKYAAASSRVTLDAADVYGMIVLECCDHSATI